MSDRPREFQPVEDPAEARKLLKEGSRLLASAMLWSKEQKYVLNTQMSVLQERDDVLYVSIPAETDPGEFFRQLGELGSHDCYFSVSLTRANIFFKARLLGHDDGGFRFGIPTAIYKVQRRKDMRLMIPFGRTLKIEIQDPALPDKKLSKKIFDISAGGVSFVADENESPLFSVGSVLKGMFFSIGSRKIVTDGEVRHLRPQAPDSANPGFKVGVRFTRISDADVQWISAYVFEESRKILSNLM